MDPVIRQLKLNPPQYNELTNPKGPLFDEGSNFDLRINFDQPMTSLQNIVVTKQQKLNPGIKIDPLLCNSTLEFISFGSINKSI